MITGLVIIQLLIVLALIFIGARVGGIGLGIYGMIGVFILVYGFGLAPGSAPIDVMMIIVAVILQRQLFKPLVDWNIWWGLQQSSCKSILITLLISAL